MLAGVLLAGALATDLHAGLAIVDPGIGVSGICADGRVVVGADDSGAIRWDGSAHAIPGGRIAVAANQDGSVVVGSMTSPPHAFRWTEADGLQDLGTLPGCTTSDAFGVSADGNAVVGRSICASGSIPWIWDAIGGMRSLGALDDATQGSARAISSCRLRAASRTSPAPSSQPQVTAYLPAGTCRATCKGGTHR